MPEENIDAHHHLWKYTAQEYPWMLDGMESIQKDFVLPELEAVTTAANIQGTVVVQARQTIEETEWLLQLAESSRLIRGVVGWLPLIEKSVASDLETYSHRKKLRAVRHVLHDESDDFYMLREDFNRGISLLRNFNLAYDILIFEKHLPQTIQFVERHPNQIFVVDHIAKPKIKDSLLSPWKENITALAKHENVYCKISGMVTEGDWKKWSESGLHPYFEIVLKAFGPQRLMFGSDWPVMEVACDYTRWANMVRSWTSKLSKSEQLAIMGGTAKKAYTLSA